MSAISPAADGGARDSARWGISFVIICALHLAAAALLSRTSIFVPPSQDIPPDTVLLDFDPAPVAVAAPPAVTPVRPQPPPPEPELRKEEPPPPVNAEVTLPKPPPRKPAPPRPEKIVEPAPQPTPVQVAPQPQVAATPKAPTAHAPSVDPMVTWEHKLLARLQGFLQYPRRALQRRQDGIVYVRIAIDRQGNLMSYGLERTSGIPALDEEAVAVVARAKPFPPPPPEIPGDPVVRVVPVRFILK